MQVKIDNFDNNADPGLTADCIEKHHLRSKTLFQNDNLSSASFSIQILILLLSDI